MSSKLVTTAAAVAALGDFDALDDISLVSAQRLLAGFASEVDGLQARCAAVIARRSDPSLGFSGLARKNGFVNAESFIQSVTGSTKAEATKLVRVGEMASSDSPWQMAVGTSGVSGGLHCRARYRVGRATVSRKPLCRASRRVALWPRT